MRIFLVEDHRDTLKYLTMFLVMLGHEVESARTMEEALAKISGANCDILISDIRLPDGNGHELPPADESDVASLRDCDQRIRQ